MNRSRSSSRSDILVEAYAALLQKHFVDVCVTSVVFYNGGWEGPINDTPCSLLTVEPYVPGGKRCLALNSRHPLIIAIAKHCAVHAHTQYTSNSRNSSSSSSCSGSNAASSNGGSSITPAEIGMMMGEAMVTSASWPVPGLDLLSSHEPLVWQGSPSVICGPHFGMISPVPHIEVEIDEVNRQGLAIYPKRIIAAHAKQDKGDRTKFEIDKKVQGDLWKTRDYVLMDEWNRHLQNLKVKKAMPIIPSLKNNRSDGRTRLEFQLVSYSPCLPMLLLAQLIHRKKNKKSKTNNDSAIHIDSPMLYSPRSRSLSTATSVLLSCDRLFCLTIFFGVPLIDRTNTLHGALRTHAISTGNLALPSREDIEQYQKTVSNDAHLALDQTMLEVAESLWNRVGSQKIMVAWSGGIDSTAVLVALLRTAGGDSCDSSQRRGQLLIILDDTSISENPLFYKKFIDSKLAIVWRNERTLSEIAQLYEKKQEIALLLTGELGDQLFGSSKCNIAFPKPEQEKFIAGNEEIVEVELTSTKDISLSQPWEDTMIHILEERGLLGGSAESWKSWILPQLEKAPFPIVSLYDLLWWLNFSCKWQDVTLRCLSDGGSYQPKGSMTGIIHHFYGDMRLQCWASIPHFHEKKFKDLKDWQSYKEPLKHFIYSFDENREYYSGKEKVGSLCFDLENSKLIKRNHCGIVTFDGHTGHQLRWGSSCLRDCTSYDFSLLWPPELEEEEENDRCFPALFLFEPWILKETRSVPPMMEKCITVNPWIDERNKINPFDAVPAFAEDDERKERIYNPVTAKTLHAKCAALLEPSMLSGKSVLDLGACLGSMVHYCLYFGARKAVAVEPQHNFCERMERLLESARHSWPKDAAGSFDVICSDARKYLAECQDQSYDIVIAAGVLHCFVDPTTIISEICRVAREAIVIESVYPPASLTGAPTEYTGSFGPMNYLELTPSAQVNVAQELASITGLAVVPSKSLLEDIMHAAGFDVLTVKIAEHPTSNEEIQQYNKSKRFHNVPIRFFLRCTRYSNTLPSKFKLLENIVVNEDETKHSRRSQWKGKIESWNEFSASPTIDEAKHGDDRIERREEKKMNWLGKVWDGFTASDIEVKCNSNNIQKDSLSQVSSTGTKTEILQDPFVTWKNVRTMADEIKFDGTSDPDPYIVLAWGDLSATPTMSIDESLAASFGFIYSGITKISRKISSGACLESTLSEGMWFSCPGKFQIDGGSGFVVMVTNKNHVKRGMFQIGGPLERNEKNEYIGILPYIDGCSDSILIHPTLMGYPCLNHLHFPKNIKQTQHTHPSGRAGIVFRGCGTCVVMGEHEEKNNHSNLTNQVVKKYPLLPGMVFVIPKDAPHAFETDDKSTLDIIAFHPDSDYGPTATHHPMINRTIVDGVSASAIPSIQTSRDF
eukprot:CAMPEP_0203666100 /NCGR_PEP_ID=MMETSP0090-20130426/3200_1 /ASSEMBLY_ACC=CAM_ASM_001088 /TAXON_ID=426623 /ORGANISM="Chaetoceros affinis, Strain CCMP159" /LENGTH=1400 /DNA_ID=CAMNT_0050529885 /DNA_START=59 /DNA_END=4261 /DNA_ORIENTATION=+